MFSQIVALETRSEVEIFKAKKNCVSKSSPMVSTSES